jgi:hypothetical protein
MRWAYLLLQSSLEVQRLCKAYSQETRYSRYALLDQSSTVSIVSRLWTGWSRVHVPIGARVFSVLQNVQTAMGPTKFTTQQLGQEVYHSPPSSAKVKNEWSYTCTPLCPRGMDKKNFTFLYCVDAISLNISPSSSIH